MGSRVSSRVFLPLLFLVSLSTDACAWRTGASARARVAVLRAQRGAHTLKAAAPPEISGSFYRRPAKAIERGGGFFVPGLEGDKLRLASASVASIGLVANHVASAHPVSTPQLVSEAIGLLLSVWTFAGVLAARMAAQSTAISNEARAPVVQRTRQSESSDLPLEAEFGWLACATIDTTRADIVLLLSDATAAIGAGSAGVGIVASCVRPPSSAPLLLDARAAQLVREFCLAPDSPEVGAKNGGAVAEAESSAVFRGLSLGGGDGPSSRSALLVRAGRGHALLALSASEGAFGDEDAAWLRQAGARLASMGARGRSE